MFKYILTLLLVSITLIANETAPNNYGYDDLLNTIGMMIVITLFLIIFFKFRIAGQIREELEHELDKKNKELEEKDKIIAQLTISLEQKSEN